MALSKSQKFSIAIVVAVAFFNGNASSAKSVVQTPTLSAVAGTGVSPSTIAAALANANYINLRNSVIDTNLIAPLYKIRGNNPIFINGSAATSNLEKLKLLVGSLHLLGLEKENYWNSETEALLSQLSNSTSALQAELLLTQTLVNIASDASTGRSVLRSIDLETDFKKAQFADYQTLNQIISSNDYLSSLAQLEPQHPQYVQLKQVLAKLYSIKENGGWKKITGEVTLKPGVSSSDVPAIRQRLADLNFISPSDRDKASNVYDSSMVSAIKMFQSAMKLQADGICGRNCMGALQTSIDQRISQINVNLERWRWLPRNLSNRYVFVNLARQELRVFENDAVVLAMNTVNGRLLRRTPTMVDKIWEVLLNPYWTVPNSIAIKDEIPKQIQDPNFLASVHIRVLQNNQEVNPASINWAAIGRNIPFTLRQDPGPDNSLGTVKFNLTNSRAIYLHDTPHHEDFPNTTRLKSSGCVRLEKPHDLANYLLQGTEWTPDRLDYMYQNWMTYPAYPIHLKQSIPVYLTYLTASIGDQGQVQFSPDYYGQDERLINASHNKEGF